MERKMTIKSALMGDAFCSMSDSDLSESCKLSDSEEEKKDISTI